MKSLLSSAFHSLVSRTGYALVKKAYAPDFWDMNSNGDALFTTLYEKCKPYTLTSQERMYALYKAVEYVVRYSIPGDFVECGVWRGGSSMMAGGAFKALGDTTRHLHLYDTYDGMPEPTAHDKDFGDKPAAQALQEAGGETFSELYRATLDEVQRNVSAIEYPSAQTHYIVGRVEETLQHSVPKQISILRLDTDWYESTYCELTTLFPQLVPGGVLIIDDYGHWKGARDATDRYLAESESPILLNRIDQTGRIAIKLR